MSLDATELHQLHRWHADLVILSLLHRQPLHGYAVYLIFQEEGKMAFQMKRHAFYNMLHRLERRRLIQGSWEVGLNHRKQFVYTLTKVGEEGLAQRLGQWVKFVGAVERLLKFVPQKKSSGQILKIKTLTRPKVKTKKERQTVIEAILWGSLSRHFPLRRMLKGM